MRLDTYLSEKNLAATEADRRVLHVVLDRLNRLALLGDVAVQDVHHLLEILHIARQRF